MKGERIAKKFNDKCFIYNKTGHLAKNYKNRGSKEIIRKGLLKPLSPRLITSLMKFQK